MGPSRIRKCPFFSKLAVKTPKHIFERFLFIMNCFIKTQYTYFRSFLILKQGPLGISLVFHKLICWVSLLKYYFNIKVCLSFRLFVCSSVCLTGSEMVEAKHVSGKNIFWSTLTAKSRGGKIFEFLDCPFEGRANMHHRIQPNWLTSRCCLAGGSKGQCRKSKIFFPCFCLWK